MLTRFVDMVIEKWQAAVGPLVAAGLGAAIDRIIAKRAQADAEAILARLDAEE